MLLYLRMERLYRTIRLLQGRLFSIILSIRMPPTLSNFVASKFLCSIRVFYVGFSVHLSLLFLPSILLFTILSCLIPFQISARAFSSALNYDRGYRSPVAAFGSSGRLGRRERTRSSSDDTILPAPLLRSLVTLAIRSSSFFSLQLKAPALFQMSTL